MKTWLRFWQNQFFKIITGAVLLGLCLPLSAQDLPLSIPNNTTYPGIIETLERLIQIDHQRIQKRSDTLIKNGKVFQRSSSLSNLEFEPDFLNSIILHSDPGYLRLASTNKCRFYEAILTDLLKVSDGRIKNILMTYTDQGERKSSIIGKRDFLKLVVLNDCPDSSKNLEAFQLKNLTKTVSKIKFESPANKGQCEDIHKAWINDSQTIFLCQIHEYLKGPNAGNFNESELKQRKTISEFLEKKLTPKHKDYLNNICKNLDNEDRFCEELLNVSYWTKIARGEGEKIHLEDVCKKVFNSSILSESQYLACGEKLKNEKDLCLYPTDNNPGLRPSPDCDQISTALNHSSLKANYRDCPGNSDQMTVTNVARIISHFSSDNQISTEGPCSAKSAHTILKFNETYDNEESWKIEACYKNKNFENEKCFKTFFGKYEKNSASFSSVVAKILQETEGVDKGLACEMVDSTVFNPLLLKYRSGCFIVYEKDKCNISSCNHKILLNDKTINYIKIKNSLALSYFPSSVRDEKFSLNYLMTMDFKKKSSQINNISTLSNYFKKNKNGIIHGIACGEELLPSFFKSQNLNQCTVLPFIINGIIKEKDKVTLVVRTSADGLQTPRLIYWGNVFAGVTTYQRQHPIKQWTMYALD